jgi:hypothetical protein
MKSKINVIPVKQAPKLNNPLIQRGIRDRAAAEAWAIKNGFTTVYFMKSQEKVYGEKLLADVAEVAKGIEAKSEQLVMFAEQVSCAWDNVDAMEFDGCNGCAGACGFRTWVTG